MSENYDLVVIGSGPGGYVGAIRAAQLGMKVACVEKSATLGGTCLNIGCIPSKALLVSSEKFEESRHALAAHGVKVEGVSLDLATMLARKDKVVAENTKGVEFLFRKNKIARIHGTGRIAGAGKVVVSLAGGGEQEIAARNILIATGSEVTPLPGVAIDEERIVSSTGALNLPSVPKHLVVVGAGVIGLELGSVWRRLGAQVTVVEFLDRITPGLDLDLSKQLQRLLAKQGLGFKLSTKVTGVKSEGGNVTLTLEPAAGDAAAETVEADVVLVAIGRRPYTEGLRLAEAGVELDERQRIKVDAHYQTSVPGIYAIGDVIPGAMLAHKAEEEAVVAVEMMAGQKPHINYDAIPSVVYTWPEMAAVGKNEEELKAAGIAYKVGKFPFTANGRAKAMGDTDGFVKVLTDAGTDRILGAHILGPDAGTMIAEVVVAMEFAASGEDLGRTCHAHPTLNEAVKEAALAAWDKPLNM